MNKPHQHAEFIKAWADGQAIEFKSGTDAWTPLFSIHPFWHPLCQYRVVEPVRRVVTFRVYLGLNDDGSYFTDTVHQSEPTPENDENFLRWISEWEEVAV